jgi:hypothetical protein
MSLPTATPARPTELEPGQLLSVEAPAGCICVAHGQVWLTEHGALRDSVLVAGAQWRLRGRPVLVGALAPTRLHLCGTAAGRRGAGGALWRRLARAWQRQVQRLQFGPVQEAPWP